MIYVDVFGEENKRKIFIFGTMVHGKVLLILKLIFVIVLLLLQVGYIFMKNQKNKNKKKVLKIYFLKTINKNTFSFGCKNTFSIIFTMKEIKGD